METNTHDPLDAILTQSHDLEASHYSGRPRRAYGQLPADQPLSSNKVLMMNHSLGGNLAPSHDIPTWIATLSVPFHWMQSVATLSI